MKRRPKRKLGAANLRVHLVLAKQCRETAAKRARADAEVRKRRSMQQREAPP